jgi:glycosyltransferase involved in cell wall biosynthesis
MKILLVSQMYPGPDDPDLGAFVQGMERALADRGHEIELAVTRGRGGGKRRHLRLARATARAARRFQPDVVYAHFLVPTGLSAALFGRAPLVATAHGRDVRNIGAYPGIAAATRFVARRASSLIAVSDYLRRELEAKIPEARGKTEVVDCGVDLDLFTGSDPIKLTGSDPVKSGANGPVFVCVGSLIERKNVVRLADAFASLGTGRLVFVGDGPLRSKLEGRPNVEITGRVAHEQVPRYIAEATVLCQPSTIEPFGQALLEGMASGRSVVATRIGGPPEFVPPEAGVLVDPLDTAALADGMRRAAALPSPNPAARAAAAEHDVRRQAEKIETILERAARGRRA